MITKDRAGIGLNGHTYRWLTNKVKQSLGMNNALRGGHLLISSFPRFPLNAIQHTPLKDIQLYTFIQRTFKFIT